MSTEDYEKLLGAVNRFKAYLGCEVNGFLYKLGFSSNGSGLLHKKDNEGKRIIVVKGGHIFLNNATGSMSNSKLSQRNWTTLQNAFERGWKLFIIVCIDRTNPRNFVAKRCKRKQGYISVTKFGKIDHIVAFEIQKSEDGSIRWHVHDSDQIITTDPKTQDRIQKHLNILRTYTHKFLKKQLGLEHSGISLQYGKIADLGFKRSCAVNVLWVIQESLKCRDIPVLTTNPNLTHMFLSKMNHSRWKDNQSIEEWQWTKLDWKFDNIIDKLVQDDTLTWSDVIKMKAQISRAAKKTTAHNEPDDDRDYFIQIRKWRPPF